MKEIFGKGFETLFVLRCPKRSCINKGIEMSEKIQEKSEYKIEHLEAEDAEKVAMTAEKKNP